MEQIGNRADRMTIGGDELFLYSGTNIEVHDSGLDCFSYNVFLMIALISAYHVTFTYIMFIINLFLLNLKIVLQYLLVTC